MSNLEEHIKASPPISSHLMLLAPSFSFSNPNNSIQKLLFLRTQQCTLCIALHCFWVLFQYIILLNFITLNYQKDSCFPNGKFQRRNLFRTQIYDIQLVNDTLKSIFPQLSMVIIYVCDNREPQINMRVCYKFETNKIQLCLHKDSNYLHIMQIFVA